MGRTSATSSFSLFLLLTFAACSSSDPDPSAGGTSGTSGGTSGTSGGTSGSTSSGTSGATSSGGSQEDGGTTSGGVKDAGAERDSATPPGCYDYGSFTPKSVSFATDVMPLFQLRCASCHGNASAGTYYGPNAAVVYAKLLNGIPVQAPQLKFVVPGDPLRSYMLAKIEYANPGGTCSVVQCTAPGCNLFAPPGGMLAEPERAVLRSWVMNGALNN